MNKGEIWIVDLSLSSGKEQKGTRPALILSDTKTGLVIVIPLTTNYETLKYSNTLEIKKSKINNLDKDSVALLFQMRSIDKKRLINKIGNIEESYIIKVNNTLKQMLKI